VAEVFLTPAVATEPSELAERVAAAHVPVRVVTDRVLSALADTQHPQGIIAVCHQRPASLAAVLGGQPRLLVVLDCVADPGNAGTIVRTADAAGADAVVFTGDGADPFGPKSVRASAGSVFHVPLVIVSDIAETVATIRDAGLAILATDPHASTSLIDVGPRLVDGTAWLFGNEARGLGSNPAQPDARVRIPMAGRAESLNLAAAAAVCIFASAMAHRSGSEPLAGVQNTGHDEPGH
jgi:RNA methyltransferase, TrmH family